MNVLITFTARWGQRALPFRIRRALSIWAGAEIVRAPQSVARPGLFERKAGGDGLVVGAGGADDGGLGAICF